MSNYLRNLKNNNNNIFNKKNSNFSFNKPHQNLNVLHKQLVNYQITMKNFFFNLFKIMLSLQCTDYSFKTNNIHLCPF